MVPNKGDEINTEIGHGGKRRGKHYVYKDIVGPVNTSTT